MHLLHVFPMIDYVDVHFKTNITIFLSWDIELLKFLNFKITQDLPDLPVPDFIFVRSVEQ